MQNATKAILLNQSIVYKPNLQPVLIDGLFCECVMSNEVSNDVKDKGGRPLGRLKGTIVAPLDGKVRRQWFHNAKFAILSRLGVRMTKRSSVSFYLSGSRYQVEFYNNNVCRVIRGVYE